MTISAWSPLRIGESQLEHRIVLAPLTRNRGTPSQLHKHTWVPNDLMLQYYEERATKGGLLITEATPVSLRASGVPGIPGLFTEEQQEGWKKIVDAVHQQGGVFFCQIWHQGRTTHSCLMDQIPHSSSDVALQGKFAWNDIPARPYEKPVPMSKDDIEATQNDFVQAAVNALSVGFDGIEVHAGNGYLFDQFHHSNINLRDDEYGRDIEGRSKFTLETVQKLCNAIGAGRVAVRLSPFGLFNETLGEERIPQWQYLCTQLGQMGLAYVHLIEPRFDEFKSASEKLAAFKNYNVEDLTLKHFKQALGSTPIMAAGGFGPDNFQEGLQSGAHDLMAFGRFFVANPDLVQKLRDQEPLYKWDRSRFYGPFPDNEVGYTVHPSRVFAASGDISKGQLA
ncbi:FMN-linked oxidoreductase [Cystobasidium minutum MCA 4210]|uniref:FMN-linked oxidoreductase n=1 Tax=Cystobasidium minutum MCA 4210 TaxID=1397322 RepID=UPI0034CDC0D5|eukprot:jgi/Rhomi1/158830/estExt_Genewise1Plus.C_3_t10008